MTTDRQVLRASATPPTATAIEYIRLRDYDDVFVRLQDYDCVMPGGADRVRALVEQQQEHRRRSAAPKPWRGFSFEAGLFAATLMMTAAALLRAC